MNDNLPQKPKQTRPKKSEQMSVHTQPGDNRKYLEHSLKMWDWPKVDMKDDQAVGQRCVDYFQLCADDDMKPTVAGLAFAFGVERRTLTRWMVGEARESISPTIKKAYEIITIQMENYMQNGKINPVAGIFLMKNNMGYQDKSEVVLTPNNPLGDSGASPEDLQKKYLEAARIGLPEGEEAPTLPDDLSAGGGEAPSTLPGEPTTFPDPPATLPGE